MVGVFSLLWMCCAQFFDKGEHLAFGSFLFGNFFFLLDLFWICLSQNGSMNIKYDEIIYIYSDRVKFLVLESLD